MKHVMLEGGSLVCEGYGCGSELEGGGATGDTVFEDDCIEGDFVAEDDGLEGDIALLGDDGDALSPYNTPNRLAIPLNLEEEGLTDSQLLASGLKGRNAALSPPISASRREGVVVTSRSQSQSAPRERRGVGNEGEGMVASCS